MTRLVTERLVLRHPQAGDEADFVDFYMSDRAQHVGGPLARSRASLMFHSHLGLWATRGFGMWAVTFKGTNAALGLVGCFYPDGWPEKELGWVLYADAEGKGIAFEAAKAARAHAFETLGWATAVSYIALENTRSVALAERLGAVPDAEAERPEGKPCHVYRHPSEAV